MDSVLVVGFFFRLCIQLVADEGTGLKFFDADQSGNERVAVVVLCFLVRLLNGERTGTKWPIRLMRSQSLYSKNVIPSGTLLTLQ